jgi:hypothetical protein
MLGQELAVFNRFEPQLLGNRHIVQVFGAFARYFTCPAHLATIKDIQIVFSIFKTLFQYGQANGQPTAAAV